MPALSELCVVVPCGPGELAWRSLLPQLGGLPAEAQIVLSGVTGRADWPPADAAFALLSGLRARLTVISGAAGRGAQQNRGAAQSQHTWLWFLHADSRLHSDSLARIAALPAEPALAYFDLAFHDGTPWMQLNRAGAWLRSRWLGLPFGDQGLLLPRHSFQTLGGFDETLRSGEDHALVWAARRAGLKLVPLGLPLYTSARRYAEHGWLRTTARHLRLTWQQARQFSGGAR
ncbi:glycosyl transferase family 2 [Pseudomarimonas arenosa]|uniref:Glycosyl transferase family 2 n=1 Tax=Pseudomarimonas arenosa TaxID=2774145 RepID=A0AAW3ZEA3_9GAMM|nr:glycosyl transferase family 2 [Pseudomarimonas arenosa]MBD8524461.1 glycosyl transferase family 2 [Pseudomarimonas arenosa]